MSRRAAWTLIALCAWTLWVWTTRMWIIAHQDQTMGFKVVHTVLGIGSIAFGLAAGWIGYRALRPRPGAGHDHLTPKSADIADREVSPSR
jgi:hypothetical protein